MTTEDNSSELLIITMNRRRAAYMFDPMGCVDDPRFGDQ
jgi:hypothetical protein